MPSRGSLTALFFGAALLSVGAVFSARARQQPAPPPTHAAHTAHDSQPKPASSHAGHASHAGVVDWGAMSDKDLDVAAIFLTARQSGVAAALDSLRALTLRDPAHAIMGHVIAHALGRFAVARAGGDPAVYAQCTQEFQAGCWHGVMEGYFTSARAADSQAVSPRALDALCATIVKRGGPKLPLLECAHGMGHGLTARATNDYRRALASCDALSASDARGECHDGVFMEVAVRGTEPRAGTNDAALLRRADLRYPCDSVAPSYQASCWEYQPIIVEELTHDVARTVQLCLQAPASSVAACHHGFGKQTTGWLEGPPEVLAACKLGSPRFLSTCIAGAAESYIDETWTPGRALALCRIAPTDTKGACYTMLGARLSLVRTSPDQVNRDCAGVEPTFVDVCRRATVAP